jgi:hypothetical protein
MLRLRSRPRRSHFQEALFTTSVRRCAAFEKRFQGLEPDADEFAGGFARSKTPGADLPFDVTRCAAEIRGRFPLGEDCRIYRFDGRMMLRHVSMVFLLPAALDWRRELLPLTWLFTGLRAGEGLNDPVESFTCVFAQRPPN